MKAKLLNTIVFFIITATSVAQTTFTVEGLNYEVTSTSPNEVQLTGGTPATTNLIIPATVSDTGITYSVTTIGAFAFGGNEDSENDYATITSLTLPNTIREIEDFAFSENQITGDVVIPNSVTTIGDDVFYRNEITSATLPNGIAEIPKSLFAFNDITAITIPEDVTSIGEGAFLSNQLASFTIPSSLTTIGRRAFDLNPITEVTALGTTAPSIIPLGFFATFQDVSGATLNIPANTLSSYVDSDWSVFGTIIAGGTTFESAFTVDGINYLVRSLSPNEVAVIDQEGTLSAINIPSTVSNDGITFTVVAIAEKAFEGNSLTSVTIPNSITSIEDSAFLGNNLTSIVLPNTVSSIGSSSFEDNEITQLTLSAGLTTIPQRAFLNNELPSITIPNGVTTIDSNAFRNNQLTTFILPNSVVSIGTSAFSDNNISDLTLPNGLTTISNFAFRNNNLTAVTIPNSVTTIGNNAFENNQLETLVIPDNVTSIDFRAFLNNNLTSVSIGSGITTIQSDVFASNQLTEVTIPSTVTTIRFRSFNNNPLTTVISEATTPPSIIAAPNDSFGNRANINLTVPTDTEDAYATVGWTGFNAVNGTVILQVGRTFDANGLSYVITSLTPNEVEVTGGTNIPTALAIPDTVSIEDTVFTVVSVGEQAFEDTGLTSVTIPNTVTEIKTQAFRRNDISSLDLGTGISSIGVSAFGQNDLTSITLPSSITVLSSFTFFNNLLNEVIALGNSPASVAGNTFGNLVNIDLTVPDGTEDDYLNAGWTGFNAVNGISDLAVMLKIFLQGASLNPNTDEENLMRDDLRVAGLLPTTSPYADAVTAPATVFEVAGENAIVDWVLVELRNSLDSSQVITSTSALVQRDGDVVALDGISPIEIAAEIATYFIVIQHRNHLGIITANPVSLSTTPMALDFTTDTTLTKGGVNALKEVSAGVYALFSGDFNNDKVINFNDRTAVLFLIGGSISTYTNADMNMNAQINFTDVNGIILFNIGRFEQFTTSE